MNNGTKRKRRQLEDELKAVQKECDEKLRELMANPCSYNLSPEEILQIMEPYVEKLTNIELEVRKYTKK